MPEDSEPSSNTTEKQVTGRKETINALHSERVHFENGQEPDAEEVVSSVTLVRNIHFQTRSEESNFVCHAAFGSPNFDDEMRRDETRRDETRRDQTR